MKRSVDSPTVSPAARRPSLSNTVKDLILDELILNGAVGPGELMPTEAELCARYAVSRITVRSALRSLSDAGYIDVRQGRGSTVLPRATTLATGLDRLSSLEALAETRGGALSSDQVEIVEVSLDAEDAGKLGLEAGAVALAVRRVKLLGGVPIAWIADYIPEGVIPFDQIRDEFTGSVLDVLMDHAELQVEYADATLDAVAADRKLARLLGVKAGAPLLSLEEVTLTRSGRPIDLSKCWMIPQHFSCTVRRRRGQS